MTKNLGLFLTLILFASTIFSQTQKALQTSKLSPRLERLINEIPPSTKSTFLVKTENLQELKIRLKQNTSKINLLSTYPQTSLALISTDITTATLISNWSEVTFIDIRDQSPSEELAIKNFDLSVNEVEFLQNEFPELTGQGMNISIKEARYDSVDMDLVGRYIPSSQSTSIIETHATTMASMIAGAGNSFYTGRGVAPEASHTSTSFYNLLPESSSYFNQYDISVQNHSYGIGIESYYGAEAEAYDNHIYQNEELIHVFSVGNSGLLEAQEGPYAGIEGFANLTGNFKMAKNLLTVGSVDSFLNIEPRSSHGPAHDGRIKPELVAYGPDGSSGAAAITSGVSLLIQEAYKEVNGNLPNAALVKAALLNGAKDLLTPGPDFFSGFGNVQAYESVKAIQEKRYIEGELAKDEFISYQLSAPPRKGNLKITLCWLDPPAQPNASQALVNDLDLMLLGIDTGGTWLPWTLNTSPNPDSLSLAAVRRQDTINPQEQVLSENVIEEHYVAIVTARKISNGKQRYALVYEWEESEALYWTHPSENLFAQQRNIIRWKNSYEASTGRIEYRLLDQNSDWTLLTDNASLTQEYHVWEVPDVFSQAQLRMIIANDTMNSDTFMISRPLDVTLQLDCADSLIVSWEKLEEAESYQLWTFDNNQLDEIYQTSDNFAILPAFEKEERLIGVQPLFPDNLEGIRSPLFNLDFQNAGCYIQNFLIQENSGGIESILDLGAFYRIDQIRIEKLKGIEFETLTEFFSPNQLQYTYLDSDLKQGAHTYRAVIELENGLTIYSVEQTIIYTEPFSLFLYPNPAYEGEDVYLETKNLEGSTFYLYDQMGRLVEELSIDVETEFLFTDLLSKGIYYYQIRKDGEVMTEGGKLVVN